MTCTLKVPGYWQITLQDSCTYKDGQQDTWSGSGTTQVTATSVGVAKLQYKDGSKLVDISGTMYVVTSTQVTFKAVPAPNDAAWPSGSPTWTGASGKDDTATASFSSPSADLTHPTAVKAACGTSSATASVIVCDLIPVRTPEDNFVGRSDTRYGVGEILGLRLRTNPSGVTAVQLGGARWIQVIPISGSGSLTSSPAKDGTGTYICQDVASTAGSSVALQLQILGGPSNGKTANSSFSVVSPSNLVFTKVGAKYHVSGRASVGFWAAIYFRPVDVSFHNCLFSEDTCPSVMNGWYELKYPDGITHEPAPDPIQVGLGDATAGCRVGGVNTLDNILAMPPGSDPPPPWATGSFVWNIPERYQVVGSPSGWHQILKAQQKFTIDAVGTMAVSKQNAGPVTAAVNEDTSP